MRLKIFVFLMFVFSSAHADVADALKNIDKKNYEAAFVELKRISDEPVSDELGGNSYERAYAKLHLSSLYYRGFGVAQDYSESLRLLNSITSSGFPAVYYAIGLHYYYGKGVAKNIDLAKKLFKKSADLGSPEAKKMLEKTVIVDETEWISGR